MSLAALPTHDPFQLFADWFAEARRTEPADPNAMTLATVDSEGMPDARIVLLKDYDAQGFVFYTNYESRKGQELAANPLACLNFHWKSLQRQVRLRGRVEKVNPAEADLYFATRPRISKLGAWASDQSRPLADRSVLESRLAEAEARFPTEEVPRPPHWSGFRLVPRQFEFWREMPYRLHDRLILSRKTEDGGWDASRLFP